MKSNLFKLAVATLLFAHAAVRADEMSPATQPASTQRNMVPQGPIDPQSINDVEMSRAIVAGAREIVAKGKLPPAQQMDVDAKAKAKVTLLPATGQRMSAEDLYRDRSQSVVVVGTVMEKPNVRVTSASGFCIAPDTFVTNYHVVHASKEGASGFVVMSRDGHVKPVVQVLAASEMYDCAIVKVDGLDVKPLAIADHALVGSPVHIISNPNHKFWYYSQGIVDRYDISMRKTAPVDTLQISADYARGSSGAPILNSAGEVVGMVATTDSIYYSTEKGVQMNLQMVMKQCVTSAQILDLIEH